LSKGPSIHAYGCQKLQKLVKHTEEEGTFDISFNFLANPKSQSCINKVLGTHSSSY
jgi:hypothetical protein